MLKYIVVYCLMSYSFVAGFIFGGDYGSEYKCDWQDYFFFIIAPMWLPLAFVAAFFSE